MPEARRESGERQERHRTRDVMVRPAMAIGVLLTCVLATSLPAQSTPAPTTPSQPPVVGAGDKVILRVWREPEWSDSLVVDAAGGVVLPRVGRFQAGGLTPTQFGDSIRTRLAVYLRDPAIDLVVLRRVAVLGAVRKPNVYYVDPVTSLREVLAYAGGLDETADANRVEIIRDGVRLRVGKWAEVAESVAPVRSGDQVFVAKRPWFTRNVGTIFSSVALAASVLLTAIRR
jgi:protein involved in polysaccharide export with SLBB domain